MEDSRMSAYQRVKEHLRNNEYRWLVTGAGGFIGSNLVEALLKLNQNVIGLDNFSTGYKLNIKKALKDAEYKEKSGLFSFVEGDVSDKDLCLSLSDNVDYILHQAALGSVPRSIKDPLASANSNITGFLNILYAAKESKVQQLVYASSSSVYGSNEDLPKIEDKIGEPLSPYALTKSINEQFAEVFSKTYNYQPIGLRYFNVFGKRQNIQGPYAAVIPRWIIALLEDQEVEIYGDGYTGRDFCYIENVIQANILAATTNNTLAKGEVYNVALNDITNLNDLFDMMKELLSEILGRKLSLDPSYKDFRPGDIKSSQADISKIQDLLDFEPEYKIREGLLETIKWFADNHRQ